jgi:hypothetical protein
MSLDLTKEIKLDEKNHLRYQRLQILFYVFCFSLLIFLAYLILFPTQTFNFSFVSPNKGNVINPRDEKGTLITDGKFSAGQKSYFDVSLVGSFSKIKVSFTPNKNSEKPEDYQIDLRKSYEAFLYPEGPPIGFKNGTLLKRETDFYLVSEGKLRKFASRAFASALSFSEEAFFLIDADSDLGQNPKGEDILSTEVYPIDTLFRINDDYYRMGDSATLEKFVSPKAFQSQYPTQFAITKNSDFLESSTISENQIGFADGSLVSYGLSAYIVSGNKIYPIGDPDIFTNQGYAWTDLITIDGAEFSFYEKQKLFTLTSAHPDDTVFSDPQSGNWYLIKDGEKHRLPSEKIAHSWLANRSPIVVSEQSLKILGSCRLKKELLGNYSCFIPLNDKEDTAGKYYEFAFAPQKDLKISNLNLLYKKNMTMQNLKLSLRSMILRIKARYGIQSTPSQ